MQNDLLAKDSSNGDDGTESHDNSDKVKDAEPEDVRDSGEVTQQQVETDEVRAALKGIMCLPYDGEMAMGRLEVNPDLIADCEYVSTWLSTLVITYRRAEAVNARKAKEESSDE